jgi:ribonucleoside-diphosphate reductase beta chain
VLKDTVQQVHYTAREETLHAQIGIKLVQTIRKEFPELFDEELVEKIKHEAICAFEAESNIIDWILGDYHDNKMSSKILKEYIKSRINDSLVQIGFEKIFDLDESLFSEYEWMDEDVLGNTATDFFYRRPVEYAKSNQCFNADDLF